MIRKPGLGILDYGSGNIASLRASLLKIGYRPHMLVCPEDFEKANVIVIPGVGAFPQAMEQISKTGLSRSILNAHEQGRRIVGICVGMQILSQKGFEIQETEGLGLLDGEVRRHPDGLQVGWMPALPSQGKSSDVVGKKFYFNHTYHLVGPPDQVLYSCQSATQQHAAVVRKGNVFGIQFHPEKSQRNGLELLGSAIRGELT